MGDYATYIALGAQALPAIVTVIVALLAGGLTSWRMLAAAAKVVAILADTALSNEEKRDKAVKDLYTQFPIIGKVIPQSAMETIVETAWHGIVKPAINTPLPPAPPAAADEKKADQ